MKVTIARIKLVLKKGKTYTDGTHPIMLSAAFNGKYQITTGYSCLEKHWDKHGECVKRSCPNAAVINRHISHMKACVIERRDAFERQGIVYTAHMLLERSEPVPISSSKISVLVDQYISDYNLSVSSAAIWHEVCKLLICDNPSMVISELTLKMVTSLVDRLKSEGKKDSTIQTYVNKVSALQRYALRKGLIGADQFIFDKWKFRPQVVDESYKFVSVPTLPFIKDFISSYIFKVEDDSSFTLSDGVPSSLMPIYIWSIGCFCFQGLSPIDLFMLKKSDLKNVVINEKSYWSIKTSRLKTGKPVHILIDRGDMFSNAMVSIMLYTEGIYFLPFLNRHKGSDAEMKLYCKHVLHYLNKGLKKTFKVINSIIINYNVENDSNIPLIEDDLSMYSYRHTFANAYMKNGGNIVALATMLGHGKNFRALHYYVKKLESDESLAEQIIRI